MDVCIYMYDFFKYHSWSPIGLNILNLTHFLIEQKGAKSIGLIFQSKVQYKIIAIPLLGQDYLFC